VSAIQSQRVLAFPITICYSRRQQDEQEVWDMSRSLALPDDGETVTTVELFQLTNDLIDRVLFLLRRGKDADIVFVPDDPLADDPGAALDQEAHAGWTLGHIVAHLTASAEESAALGAELARGVPYHGRSRQEVPWQAMTTAAHCRARLRECRRICLASLAMWPDQPDLANTYVPWEGSPPVNATARYLLGLRHAAGHLAQVREVLAQARADRKRRAWWRHARTRHARAARQPVTVTTSDPAS
jgi:hypothetical protein